MKIKYHEWKCIGCGTISRFTGKEIFSPIPYWFTIRTEGGMSSSERPSINTSACSIPCFEKAGALIDDLITNHKYSIPNKKDISATICDQCGKVQKSDALNPLIGPNPLRDWTWEETPAGRKDFCSDECKKNHSVHPEESVFVDFKPDQYWRASSLIEVINSPDVKEAIKLVNEKSKRNPFGSLVT